MNGRCLFAADGTLRCLPDTAAGRFPLGGVAEGFAQVQGNSLRSDTTSSMNPGDWLTSSDGHFILRYETDGRLRILKEVFATNPQSAQPGRAVMQPDGNMTLYDANNSAYFNTNTAGKGSGPYRLTMQKDANLVLYSSDNTPLWSSSTSGICATNIGTCTPQNC